MNDTTTVPGQRPAGTTERTELIGAEMRYGSDPAGPAAVLAEPFLSGLVTRAATILFAGVHDPGMVSRSTPGRTVSLQLRRVADAASADADPRLREARILCGSIAQVSGAYDLVVALGGLDLIGSPDDAEHGWQAALRGLAARVAPDGVLVVAVANAFGLRRLNSLARTERADEHATDHDALVRAMSDADLTVTASLGAYPDLAAPHLLIHRDLLSDPRHRDLAALLVAGAAGERRPGALVSDPRVLHRDAVRHGMGHALAAGWIVIGHRPGAAVTEIPAVAVTGRSNTTARHADPVGAQGSGVEQVRLWATQTSPTGELLTERLAGACARHDLDAIRVLLTRYTSWLEASTDGGATPSMIVDDGSNFHLLAAGVAVPVGVMFTAGLLEFAYDLQAAGLAHPWPATLTPQRLAIRLAAMAGVTLSEKDLEEARERSGPDPDDQAPVGPSGELARPSGYTEAVGLATAISRELAEARAQLRFLAETLADRDQRLREQSTVRRLLRLARRPVGTVRSHRRHGRSIR